MNDVVARQLVHARRRAGLSQHELARRAGLPVDVLSAYETGRLEPSAAVSQQIVHAAGGTVVVSVPSAQERRERDEELQDVLALADALPNRPPAPLLRPTLRPDAG